ncbi:hypothetical protein niasHT_031527 [Heterodera trifolii]|uniref:Uncharacterized protein n=1 Tax=Heterodera trifolii TaxID=157864 RepID=A0ABD2HQP0_9BILA
MERLVSLELLDLHCNMVALLPDELLRCRALRTLGISGNKLTELPLNIGDLQNLAELVLCENQIRHLPSSVGRPKIHGPIFIGQLNRLEVLKDGQKQFDGADPVNLFMCTNSSNATDDNEAVDADPDAAGSLSQRAAEIEKRREWRQARLRSMDVESCGPMSWCA